MNARLKVLHEKANVKSVKLLPVTVIGRSNECDLKIAASEVSRIHCRITIQEDAVFIEDLGSANGTFVNDEILAPHQPIALEPGTKISIGRAEFLVDYTASTSNTVIVRRSDKSGKPVPAPIKSSDSEELVFSSIPDSAKDSTKDSNEERDPCADSTLVTDPKDNPFAAARELVVRELSAENLAALNLSDACTPAKEPAATSKPSRPVLAKGSDQKPQKAPPAKGAALPRQADVPEGKFVVPKSDYSESVHDEMPQFNFAEGSEAHPKTKPAPKPDLGGGLKSLFSVFNRKASAAPSAPKELPATDTVDEKLDTCADSPIPPAPDSPFSFGQTEKELPSASAEQRPVDDDFQNFLRQF